MALKQTLVLDFDRATPQDLPSPITVSELLRFADAVRAADLDPDDEIEIVTFDYNMEIPIPIGFRLDVTSSLDG